jgi:hypothetical protein
VPHESRCVPSLRDGRREQSYSTGWAGRQEKLRPEEKCLFLNCFYRTYKDLRQTPIMAVIQDLLTCKFSVMVRLVVWLLPVIVKL